MWEETGTFYLLGTNKKSWGRKSTCTCGKEGCTVNITSRYEFNRFMKSFCPQDFESLVGIKLKEGDLIKIKVDVVERYPNKEAS